MNISAKTEYACIAVLELAMRADHGEPIPLKEITDKHGIPSRFLVQILLQLKSAGIVRSIRGASGGYLLAGDPAEISLGQVMEVIDGKAHQISDSACGNTSICKSLQNTWQRLADQQHAELCGIMLSDLVESARSENENMYYI